ncbi:MAG: tetratricopeptide repeat protein [Holophagales bacterium]|nr:tetratricopeptide repeat protein [Holophagales bacterium]MYG31044.1 tetratricopeptide repeat protein [Holophagales bacterium]MYI80168.1 tetratricopeptide repeat protein [Holophagales bacterium]
MKNVARPIVTTVALATALTTWSCQGDPLPCGELSGTDVEEWSPRLRGDVEAALPSRQEAFEADPDNDEVRRAYAEVLFKLGNIWEADEVTAPLAATDACHAGDLRLAARTAYLLGDYARAVALNERLLELADDGSDVHAQALRGLTLAHYQTGDFASARALPAPDTAGGSASLLTFMQAFEGEPYGIEWTGEDRIAHLPMTNDIAQPGALPLVTLEINGEAVSLILDTGGDRLYLDQGIYERLGLPILANREARYAYTGGETVEEPLGVAATVTMGDVTLSNVPVIGATWKALGQTSDGVLTTQLLKQFLTTVDYDNRRITFRERSAEALADVMETFGDTPPVESPFYMTSTHLMFARGSLNGHPGMNYFLDSGLAASMPLVIVEETIEFLELEKTEIEGTPYYWSPIESHGLDGLPSGPAQALGNVFVDSDFFWRFGFMADVLISHQYLWPKGSWTIDFDEMKYYFPGEGS